MTFFTVYSAYVQSLFFFGYYISVFSHMSIYFIFSGHYTSFFHTMSIHFIFPDIILLFFTLCPSTSFFQTLNTTLERQPICFQQMS